MQDRFGTLKLLHKEMMNMSNERIRRCRVGRVQWKKIILNGVMKSGRWEPVAPPEIAIAFPSARDTLD